MKITLKYNELSNLIQVKSGNSINIIFSGNNTLNIHLDISIRIFIIGRIKKQMDLILCLKKYTNDDLILSYQTENKMLMKGALRIIKRKMSYVSIDENNDIIIHYRYIPQIAAILSAFDLEYIYLDNEGFNIKLENVAFR